MSSAEVRNARAAWRATVLAREAAEEALARAEGDVERARYDWEQWDAQSAVEAAVERIEQAQRQEGEAERDYQNARQRAASLSTR